MDFRLDPTFRSHSEEAYLWNIATRVVNYLFVPYIRGHGCQSSSAQILMHTKDGTSISLGTYRLLELPPPRFDHTQHWPDFPLTLQIPGETSRESKMTFLSDAQAAPRRSGDPHH